MRSVSLLLAAVAWSSPAWAEPPANPTPEQLDRGRELYENGSMLYDEGRYEDAIVAWRQGYELTGLPDFLYNIANAQERLGDVKGALDTLGRYRAFATADERETLDRRIRSLEARLDKEPAPVPQPTPQPAPVPQPEPQPQPVAQGGGVSGRTIVGASLIGLGGASLITGTVFGLNSAGAGRDAAALCVEGTDGPLCPDTAADFLDAEKGSALAADLSFALGLALAGGGTVVLLTGGHHDNVALGVAPSGITVSLAR